jgi:hypothetical protein
MKRPFVMMAGAFTILVTLTGCQQLATVAYFLGPTEKTERAEFAFKSPAVLVLVDDTEGLVKPPMARENLVDSLARELKEHKITNKVTTNEEIARIRQAEPKFDERGARELGKLAEADTVILLSTTDFALEDELEMASATAKFSVTVRVIDAKAETKDRVRLWPSEVTEREGRLIECEIPAHKLRHLKTATEAHEKLATTLAKQIAELFYDHQVEQ